jgi:hypothetical protein
MSNAVLDAPAAHAVGVEEVPDPQVAERATPDVNEDHRVSVTRGRMVTWGLPQHASGRA